MESVKTLKHGVGRALSAGKRTVAGSGLLGLLPSIFKGFGLVVVLVSVAVGTVAKVKPSLFFKIPHVGFVPWAITGGMMPPFFANDVWKGENHESWLKDNDVVISTGVKSGTTWMLYCTHHIRAKGREGPKPFVDVSYTTPWPEMLQHPEHTTLQQVKMMHNTTLRDGSNLNEYWNNKEYPFRIFKSHYFPRQHGKDGVKEAVLPVRERPNVKYVAMARNGLEVVGSWNTYLNVFRDELRAQWGGFPPRASEDNIAEMFQSWLPGGVMGPTWWEYIACWWPFRNDPNVLLLHYNDMIADPRAGIKKLAAFVGVSLTSKEFEDVAEKCSKEFMSAHPDHFRYLLPLNPSFGDGERGWLEKGGLVSKRLTTGKGPSWTYSDAQRKVWATTEEEIFQDPALVKWAREGGSSPGAFA